MIQNVVVRREIRVVLVERDPLLRRTIRSALIHDGMTVAAETDVIEGALPTATAAFPDVVVVDLDWPNSSVLELCASLAGEAGIRGVLAMTRRCDDRVLLRSALAAGVSGYVSKSAETAEVVRAVRATAGGTVVVDQAAARLLAGLLRSTMAAFDPVMLSLLSRRELEVLELVARGYDNQRIARSLTLADKTVRNHVSSIFGKIGVNSRAQAVVRARESGLGVLC